MNELNEALLVIDSQKVYASEGSELYVQDYKAVVENINKLIQLFQKQGKPIIYIRHMHNSRKDSGRMFDYVGEELEVGFLEGTADIEYIEELEIVDEIPEVIKRRYSAFEGTSLETVLKEKGADCVVITGFMTNYCCEATARQAHDKDYFVKFILDATGAPELPDLSEEDIRKNTAANISFGFGNVISTAEYIQQNI
ncbi:cysteine hydrolase family protein [[Clostridium] polysaccharolyticum]|uniref:Isochorismatase family protein n=1 Tax=[Clostridium] polysaccharolyticum TaxID=29364 RepID=A0A1I0ARL0_9FIRM|nr:isochorismatase family cysteine hydrolase [[Clostridium] polysaccharolyticum]SES96978.1 Isochorismatase family protein [[Clostridium] polysaccharolyticum]